MSDQDKPSFTVVDKRRAAQEAASSEASSSAATEPESSSPSTDEIQQAAEAPGDPLTEAPETDDLTEEQQQEQELPDPALLLSMAAMHLDTPSLIATLLAVFDGHAWRSLGLVAHHATGEVKKDLPSAQLAIDCVQFLLSKVETRLSPSERHDLQRRLSDLRMNYLAKLREPGTDPGSG
jgi:hypothetical protein